MWFINFLSFCYNILDIFHLFYFDTFYAAFCYLELTQSDYEYSFSSYDAVPPKKKEKKRLRMKPRIVVINDRPDGEEYSMCISFIYH